MRRAVWSLRSLSGTLSLVLLLLLAVLPSSRLGAQAKTTHQGSTRVVLTETKELGISLLASSHKETPPSINQAEFSLEYARRKLLPAFNSSVVFADFDGDKAIDVLIVIPGQRIHLLRNQGGGKFVDVTSKAKLPDAIDIVSATFADYDNSGRPSLFLSGLGSVRVFRNAGNGTFVEQTQSARLRNKSTVLYTHTAMCDFDQDGFLDLVVTAYTDFGIRPATATFVFPNDVAGTGSSLYRNNRDGSFTDITGPMGLDQNPGRARTAVCGDVNKDGRSDFLVLRDDRPPILYLNQGHGTFKDFTYDADEQLTRNAFFDAQIVDFDHDGQPDLALWSTLGSRVLINQGGSRFELPEPWSDIISPADPFGFHGTVADVDGNGFDDVLAIDRRHGWRLLLNHRGLFQDVPVTFSPESEQAGYPDSLTPLKLLKEGPLYFIGIRPDGGAVVYKVSVTD
jgi:hypothetical protein